MRDQSYKSVNNSQPNNIRGGETNNMKKLLSTLLVFALVLTMVTPAFAATELTAAEKYEALKEAGIFAGTDKGDNLEGTLTRAEVAGIVARLFELEQPAKNPSFSDTEGHWAQNTIEAVNAAGYMTGVGFGKFAPNQTLTFEGLAALLMKVTGLEYAEEATVEGKVSDWAAKAVATVVEAGLMDAQEDYTVVASRADLAVSAYTIYQAVKLDVQAIEYVDAKNIKVTFNDGVTQEYTLDTALSMYKPTTVTVEYKGQAWELTLQLPVVDSITATMLNPYQVKVVFNGLVDETSAENVANYYVGLTKDIANNSLDGIKWEAVLQKDGKTVIIQSKDVAQYDLYTEDLATGVVKDSEVRLQARNVKSVSGEYLSTTEAVFMVKDDVRPTLTVASQEETVGDTSFEVKFSEPVDISGAKFYLNGVETTNVAAKGATTVAETSTLVVNETLANAGTYVFSAVGLKDMTGNMVSPNPAKLNLVVKDVSSSITKPAVVEVKQISDTQVRVVFDKAVIDGVGTITVKNQAGDLVDVPYTIGSGLGDVAAADASYEVPEDTTYEAYTVDFGDIFGAANYVYRTIVVRDYAHTNGSATLVGDAYTKTLKLVKDTTAPTVSKVAVNDTNSAFEITFVDQPFNGNVKLGSGDIVVKLVDGGITYTSIVNSADINVTLVDNKLSIGVAAISNTKLLNTAGDALLNSKNYTITLPDGIVTDDAVDTTPQVAGEFSFKAATVSVVTPASNTAVSVPQTDETLIGYDSVLKAITVEFIGASIDPSTATNKANYRLDGVSLPSASTVEYTETAGGQKIVYIYLPENTVEFTGNYVLSIANVATLSGAKMLPTSVTVALVDNYQPVLLAAKVTSTNTVEVTFSENVTASNVNNFKVVVGGVEYAVATINTTSLGNVVELVTQTNFDATKTVTVTVQNDLNGHMNVVDVESNKAKAGITKTATKDLE